MKIVHLIPELTAGGAERVVVNLASQAAMAGHQVAIVVAGPVDFAPLRDALHPDVQLRFIAETRVSGSMRYFYALHWLLRHRVWLLEQDILHCHLTFGTAIGIAVRILQMLSGSKLPTIVETYHSVGIVVPHRWLQARMVACFDALALIADDDYWRAFTRNHPKVLSKIILNGISDPGPIEDREQLRRAYRHEMGIPDDCRYVVGTVGRLDRDRQPWLYLPIFAQIARDFGRNVHFVLAGGGTEYDNIRSGVAEFGLEGQVHLPGLILDPRPPLAAMDLYLTLNVGSVTGLAALEAAYLGLPILAIQLLGSYRAKPDDWIWSSTDLSAIAERAVGLLGSIEERQALVERQSAYVRTNHTIDAMAKSYDSLYRAAIGRRMDAGSQARDKS